MRGAMRNRIYFYWPYYVEKIITFSNRSLLMVELVLDLLIDIAREENFLFKGPKTPTSSGWRRWVVWGGNVSISIYIQIHLIMTVNIY